MHPAASRVLRALGRAVTVVGLALFWVHIVILLVSESDPIPVALGQTGYVLAAGGCVGLAVIAGLLFAPRPRLGPDVALGLVCAATGLAGMLIVLRDSGVHVGQAYAVLTSVVLIVGGFSLAFVSVGRPYKGRWR
jgi:hypothetical protein